MATFQELQVQLTTAKQKRAVLQYLIEHIDANFRPIAGGDPKNKLVTDEKVPVPHTIFEAVVSDLLLQDGELEATVTSILTSSIAVPAVEVEDKTKKSKSTTKGETKP